MDLVAHKYTVKFPRFNGTRDDDFHPWCLRMKAVLRGRRISKALTNDNVSAEIMDDALYLIISALGHSPAGAIQNYSTAKEAWDKLQARYAKKM